MLNIFEVLSRAWSEISQLQCKTEPHQMLVGALHSQLCASRWDSGMLLQALDSHSPSPSPSVGSHCSQGQDGSLEDPWEARFVFPWQS